MTEAEIGVIGCVLIDNDSMYKVYNKLKRKEVEAWNRRANDETD